MKFFKTAWIALPCILLLGGCASLGFSSTPWPNYTSVHDEKAVDFMRGVPPVKSGLLEGGVNGADYSSDDNYVLGISVTGGGMRAAAFTLGVLEELENQGVLDDVDFISSNSGGGWGVAAYLSDRADYSSANTYDLTDRRIVLSKKFQDMSEAGIKCLPVSIMENITGERTFDELYQNNSGAQLPDHFVNAAILPSESAFVFTEAYLDYFRVTRMDACNEKRYSGFDIRSSEDGGSALANVPYGYAIATSGSVPLFYTSSAKTSVCAEFGKLWESSFCNQNARKDEEKETEIHLVDGGIHDNHGYKTAIEILSEYQVGNHWENLDNLDHKNKQSKRNLCRKSGRLNCRLIQIDSTTSLISPLTTDAGNKSKGYKLAAGFGAGSGFVGQDATALRIRKAIFDGLGTDTVLLDFPSASNRSENFEAYNENLLDLIHLRKFMETRVTCYEDSGREIRADTKRKRSFNADKRAVSDDCMRNNAYRAGTLAKTTYDYDAEAGMFPVLWDLGIFVARQKKTELKTPMR